MSEKIITMEQFSPLRQKFRAAGKKVAHCHGVFDLLHPGHIIHLEEAKTMADVLVVSVTAAKYVNKGPGRPYFSDELRMKSLAALETVDYVILSETQTALQAIDAIQPDYYIKGVEYQNADNDVTGNIDKEAQQVMSYGGTLRFTEGMVFSSTNLLNNAFPVFPKEIKDFFLEFSKTCSFEQVRSIVESMRSLNILVIGDIIIDEYLFCNVQGLTSKDRAFSARYLREERYMGGALAIVKHLAGFSKNVTMLSIANNEEIFSLMNNADDANNIILNLYFDNNFKNAVKRRYIEQRGIMNDFEKLFSINNLMSDEEIAVYDRTPFYDILAKTIKNYDLVVVADYGHGLLDRTAMNIIQDGANFIALNCQTNSSNFGTNLITKYHKADIFTLDGRELRLAYADRTTPPSQLLINLLNHLNSCQGWVTLGSVGSLGADKTRNAQTFPALTQTVQDTVGAGDAFFALAALSSKVGAPLQIGSFLGNIAGALAVNTLGNSRYITKPEVLKYAATLLNF